MSPPTSGELDSTLAGPQRRGTDAPNDKIANAATPKPVLSSSTVSPEDSNDNSVTVSSHKDSSAVDAVATKASDADSPMTVKTDRPSALAAANTSETKDSSCQSQEPAATKDDKSSTMLSNKNDDTSLELDKKGPAAVIKIDATAAVTVAPPTIGTENKAPQENLDTKMEDAEIADLLVDDSTAESPSPDSACEATQDVPIVAAKGSIVKTVFSLESNKETSGNDKVIADIPSSGNTSESTSTPANEKPSFPAPACSSRDIEMKDAVEPSLSLGGKKDSPTEMPIEVKTDVKMEDNGASLETKPVASVAESETVSKCHPSVEEKKLEVAHSNQSNADTEMSEANSNPESAAMEKKSEDEAVLKGTADMAKHEPSSLLDSTAPQVTEADKPVAQSNQGDVDTVMKDTTALVDTKPVVVKGEEPPPEANAKKLDSKNEKEDPMEEEEVEPTSLSELREALDDIDTPGSTCAAGPATCLPAIPGLSVEGVGDIPLPITDLYAKSLASVAEQAPHGKGMETIVDTSVRNTLQIDPSKVKLQNPAWKPALRELVRQAAESLGVAPSMVNAELYKLLLYEEGGFFKKHRDTEKAQGMFATLVVQLPSKFTGGSFVVSHGGESETFAMGAGAEAAFGCQFVCHYADCEHEIRKVESGYRLALIYSLCYTGPRKPSAADVERNYLSTVLQGLPADESLFVIPLEHQYTSASLARLGTSALKGSDRAKQDSIEIAGKGKWTMIVTKAERIDYESGDGSYYGGFDVYDVERGSVSLQDAYHVDGSDASNHLVWIRKQANFDSVEDGGMMLVSSEDVEEDNGIAVWGEGDEGGVEYTGNEGATRETTYSTYFLIGYAEDTAFERMCSSNFSTAVAQVAREECADLLRRMLSFMKTKKPSVTDGDSIKLLQAIDTIDIPDKEVHVAFATILSSLSVKVVPSAELTKRLVLSIERLGWTLALDPIKSYSARLSARKDLNTTDFIKQVDFLFRMEKESAANDFATMVKQSTQAFRAGTSNQSTGNTYGRYRYGYHSNDRSSQGTPDALVSLCQCYPRDKTKSIVDACVARFTKQGGSGTDNVVQRANLIQRLRLLHDASDVEGWFRGIMEDFVNMVEKLSSTATGILSSNHSDELFRLLFEFGSTNEVERVQRWAANAQLVPLTQLETVLSNVTAAVPLPPTYRDAAAVTSLVQTVQRRVKTLKLSELYTRHQKLVTSTRGGEPTFSWAMPLATSSSPALTAFLRSQRTGPETIVVGGGINNARSLAGMGRYSYGRRSNNNGSSAVL